MKGKRFDWGKKGRGPREKDLGNKTRPSISGGKEKISKKIKGLASTRERREMRFSTKKQIKSPGFCPEFAREQQQRLEESQSPVLFGDVKKNVKRSYQRKGWNWGKKTPRFECFEAQRLLEGGEEGGLMPLQARLRETHAGPSSRAMKIFGWGGGKPEGTSVCRATRRRKVATATWGKL